jgi:hypothetical protein
LIYAHEFAWDLDHDPVWARLGKVYEWYGAADRLGATHGRGKVTGQPPEATHCNNIGAEHRKAIYPLFKRWFDLTEPVQEARIRRGAAELACLTPEWIREVKPRTVASLATQIADRQAAEAHQRLAGLSAAERRQALAATWDRLLGGVHSTGPTHVESAGKEMLENITVERLTLTVERAIRVPLLLLVPQGKEGARPPVVVAVSQDGKDRFLRDRAGAIAGLLQGGVAVCLPDVRGTGETRPGDGRGRMSTATSLSASEQMLGGTLLGARVRDLLAVLAMIEKRHDLDGRRLIVWGENFAPVNANDRDPAAPLDAPDLPTQAEPLGPLLALFGGLFNERVGFLVARGGLLDYHHVIQDSFCYVPHDAMVPGALTAGDLTPVVAALGRQTVRLEGPVDGQNRRVPEKHLTLWTARALADQVKTTDGPALTAAPLIEGEAALVARILRRPNDR